MTMETVMLGLIAGFFIWRLYKAFDKKPLKPADKIRLVSRDTGEVLEMQIVQTVPPKMAAGWDDAAFVSAAKFVFQKILAAFANCDLKTLRNALSADVYAAFERDILSRQAKKQKMDFSLICFDSADILQKTPGHDEVTIRFQTEQINLLKDEQGHVVEGDAMRVSVMTDIWVFKQVGKDAWIVTATQSQAASCAG